VSRLLVVGASHAEHGTIARPCARADRMRAVAERVADVTRAAVLVGVGVGSGATTLHLTSILRVSSPVPHRLGDPTRTNAKASRSLRARG
jgi:uncharacterized protein (DUF1786 family)